MGIVKWLSVQQLTVVLTDLWVTGEATLERKAEPRRVVHMCQTADTYPSTCGYITPWVRVPRAAWHKPKVFQTRYGHILRMIAMIEVGLIHSHPRLHCGVCLAPFCLAALLFQHMRLRTRCLFIRNAYSQVLPTPLTPICLIARFLGTFLCIAKWQVVPKPKCSSEPLAALAYPNKVSFPASHELFHFDSTTVDGICDPL